MPQNSIGACSGLAMLLSSGCNGMASPSSSLSNPAIWSMVAATSVWVVTVSMDPPGVIPGPRRKKGMWMSVSRNQSTLVTRIQETKMGRCLTVAAFLARVHAMLGNMIPVVSRVEDVGILKLSGAI